MELTVEQIMDYQTLLKERGYYTGEIDGIIGPLTRAAAQAMIDSDNPTDIDATRGNTGKALAQALYAITQTTGLVYGTDVDTDDSNWAAVNSDGSGTVAWNNASPSVFDTSANEDASIYNTLGGNKLEANSKYIVSKNPHDKKWYVMGHVGRNKWMPVSNGFKNKTQAQKWAKSQDNVDSAARGEISGV